MPGFPTNIFNRSAAIGSFAQGSLGVVGQEQGIATDTEIFIYPDLLAISIFMTPTGGNSARYLPDFMGLAGLLRRLIPLEQRPVAGITLTADALDVQVINHAAAQVAQVM